MLRSLSDVVHAADHAVGRLRGPRKVLVELRTPVYAAVLRPVYDALRADPKVHVFFTGEDPDRIRTLVPGPLLTHRDVEWRRFDLYLNADPWAAARLRRCARRLNFFHGVAGKYDLDRPSGLPMGFEYYDRVAFINRDRMNRYLSAGIVRSDQARLVGYPKLDALASGRIDRRPVIEHLRLRAGVPTALYAPTYSTASSLDLAGEAIVSALSAAGVNVVIKLHDRSLDPDPRYTGGIDWRTRMRALERAGQIAYVEDADLSPYLAAADLMVTDHSSAGFEFLAVDRPLVVFDAPGLGAAARINPEKVALLRSAATVVRNVGELVSAVRTELASPDRMSPQRRQVASDMFFDAGRATARALALAYELLDVDAVPVLVTEAGRSSFRSLT
jgi:hypothetical protein